MVHLPPSKHHLRCYVARSAALPAEANLLRKCVPAVHPRYQLLSPIDLIATTSHYQHLSLSPCRQVLLELYCQVTAKLYPQLPRPTPPTGHQRRFGRPQQAHDPALCQGCAAGSCRMLKRR